MILRIDSLKKRLKDDLILKEIRKIQSKGNIFLVGGAIREIALGRKPQDYDFVLSEASDLQNFERYFNTKFFTLGKKNFQTKRLTLKDTVIDVNVIEGEIEEDLKRRDFTINSMAYDVKKGIFIDPFSGLRDLKEGIIRGTSKENLKEDPLRMLKAIRHASTLSFKLSDDLKTSIREERILIHKVAKERIKYELDRIILSPKPFEGFKLLEETGLLFEIFPELYPLKEMDEKGKFDLEIFGHILYGFKYLHREKGFYPFSEKDLLHVGYSLLFHDLGKPETFTYDETQRIAHFFYHEKVSREKAEVIMERLRFSGDEIKTISNLIENHMRIFLLSTNNATVKATRRLLLKMGDLSPHLVLLTKCDMYGSSKGRKNPSTKKVEEKCKEIMEEFFEFKKTPIKCVINGHDLLALGFKEGPMIGKILKEVLDRQISGLIKEREEALAYAKTVFLRLEKEGGE